MSKYIITNLGKGTYDLNNPISTNNLHRIGEGGNDYYLTGGNFDVNTGFISLVVDGTDDVTFNLDGRYSQTDTTYTAGDGLSLSGVQFSHASTSIQSSVDNVNGNVIQDITLDSFGHITSIGSIDLDNRYIQIGADIPWSTIINTPTTLGGYGITDAYTKIESDDRFFNVTGDTVNGDSIFNGNVNVRNGDFHFDSSNGLNVFRISRYDTTEGSGNWVEQWVNDTEAHSRFLNDERHGYFVWTIDNTDTESNGGAQANIHTFRFEGDEFGGRLLVDGQTMATENWVTSQGYITSYTDTTYTAGSGINLTGNEFSANFGTTAGTVAEGNHTHDSQYDNYQNWNLRINGGGSSQVYTGGTVGLNAGTNITLTQNGNEITIDSGGTTVTAGNGLSFSGNTLNVDFGSTAGTVAQGDDSRINNGQTAFSWGNHASVGYLTSYSETDTLETVINRGNTANSDVRFNGTVEQFGSTFMFAPNGAYQRWDVRDENATQSGFYLYGVDTSSNTVSGSFNIYKPGVGYRNIKASSDSIILDDTNNVWHTGNLNNLSQLNNDAGYVTSIPDNYHIKSDSPQLDANILTQSSYRFDPNTNNPTNHHYAGMTYGNAGNVTGQIFTHYISGESYVRAFNSGWSNWRKLWDSTNLINVSQLNNDAGYITSFSETDTLETVTNRGNSTTNFISATGKSTSWGVTSGVNTGAFNTIMGTTSSATWLISGTSGGVFRGGIQVLDGGGTTRYYTASNYFQFSSNTLSAENIVMAGNTVATQTWVTSQGYITSYTDTNDYHTSLGFNSANGNIVLSGGGAPTLTTSIDGRYLPLSGGTLTGDIEINKANPWITLDSPGSGGIGQEQGAGISIGESGKKGAAALHLTYTGDGKGHIGMGEVNSVSGIPQYKAMEFFYQDNIVDFMATPRVGGVNVSLDGHTHSYDNYNYWRLGGEGSYTNISSTESVNFTGSGATSVSRSGNTININSSGSKRYIYEDTPSGFYNHVNGKTFICNGSDIAVDIPDGVAQGEWSRIINNGSFGTVRFTSVNLATLNGGTDIFVANQGGEVIIISEGNNVWKAYGDIRTASDYYQPLGKATETITGSTYTIQGADHRRWLKFNNNCTVTIPTLEDRYLIEGEAADGVTVTFQAGSGVNLKKMASIGLTLSPNGVFGIRFSSSTNCIIYGTDPT